MSRFGGKLKAAHPDVSFYISVRLAKGCRKPNGFDTASSRNGFGQDDFLTVIDGRTAEPTIQPGPVAVPQVTA